MKYDVIVVGGGHAGCEAALATSKMKLRTILITANLKSIANTPCNPSIGGPAKGVVVREIDALGGVMGRVTDKSQLQMKLLNTRKGPAVQALRAQIDKITYHEEMMKELENTPNLEIFESFVEDFIVKDNKVQGVVLKNGDKITAKVVIVTTGTYMKSEILIGSTRTPSGPDNLERSEHLSDNFARLGFEIIRLKTGTPPRVERSSIDFSKTIIQPGDNVLRAFSHDVAPSYNTEEQKACYLTYTTEETKKNIQENLQKSSMYGGLKDLKSVGPRYCPSIEDKIVRFADKERHQIFLEPESIYYDDIYVQGLSSSLPEDVQDAVIRTIPGLENCIVKRYGYAIEYDAIVPTQLWPTLETKLIENLYTAGQINGTSGYEEAAAQGLIAGINAGLKLKGKEPLILKRSEAYIGVMIDDLVTKGTLEPYRLLTSRAEYRLLLRHDNADLRLREYGYQAGLISEEIFKKFTEKKNRIEHLKEKLDNFWLYPRKETNDYLESIPSSKLLDRITASQLLKRSEINATHIKELTKIEESPEIYEQVEIELKYAGYIAKTKREVEKLLKLENKLIPSDIDYDKINNISIEARQKLKEIRPLSIGQAARISGVNPADISILLLYLKQQGKK